MLPVFRPIYPATPPPAQHPPPPVLHPFAAVSPPPPPPPISRFHFDSRDADEGGVASVEEGAVEDLQDEGEVLEWEEGSGGTGREEEALQGGEEEGKNGRAQIHLPLCLS